MVDDLLGLHSTVPLSLCLQLRARLPTFTRTRDQLDVLLGEGRAAKLACMRRTVFGLMRAGTGRR